MKLLISVLVFLVLVVSALAIPTPAPVVGQVVINGEAPSGVAVEVTNLGTGEVLTYEQVPSLKTENGFYAFDLGQFKQGYIAGSRGGDQIRVKVCGLSDGCVQTFQIIDSSVRKLDFAVGGEVEVVRVPDVVEREVEVVREVVREVTVDNLVILCSDGRKVESFDECEDFDDQFFTVVLSVTGTILAALGVQWRRGILAIASYKWRKGQKVQALKTLFTIVKNAKAGKYKR